MMIPRLDITKVIAREVIKNTTKLVFTKGGDFFKNDIKSFFIILNARIRYKRFSAETINPNIPGYLKMNWEKVDKLNVNIYPTLNFLRSNKNKSNHQIGNNLDGKALQDLCIFNNDNQKQHILFTPKSIDYLTWRYSNNPLQSYEIFTGQGIYLAGYIKNHKYFKELRLSEVIVDKANKKNAGKIIKNWAQSHGAHIVTTAAGIDIFSKVKVSGAFGPVLTIRNLNLDTELYRQLLELENISYTLGDLELF